MPAETQKFDPEAARLELLSIVTAEALIFVASVLCGPEQGTQDLRLDGLLKIKDFIENRFELNLKIALLTHVSNTLDS